jgi:hypothetical protein
VGIESEKKEGRLTLQRLTEQTEALFAALQDRGWRWKEDVIYAPHGTMWLMRERPWEGDLGDLIERMEGRCSRISRNLLDGYEHALDNTRLLVAALNAIRGQEITCRSLRRRAA